MLPGNISASKSNDQLHPAGDKPPTKSLCRLITGRFFVLTALPQACYGVLHCSLGGAESSELEDTCQEAGLTLPPACHSYDEHDAIVVRVRHRL